jgi:cytochrome c oxidase assembly protein subunit 15
MSTKGPKPLAGRFPSLSFGASVIMWLIAYICLAPGSPIPVWATVAVLALVPIAAGVVLRRLAAGGFGDGIKLGLAIGLINFVIVASLNSADTTTEALVDGLVWVGGFTLASIILCTLGVLVAGGAGSRSADWSKWFATIVAVTTMPLLISGGIVTGLEAGMAVPDWLTTFDYPMMFFPMVKMQADTGVYAEHFHRLWGLLVGLSVITLVVHLFLVDTRAWVKALSVGVLLAVIVQGVLGGTRVTENHLGLAVAHGIFGQVVFSAIVATAAFVSASWRSERAPTAVATAATDRNAAIALVLVLLGQLSLGATYRHLQPDAPMWAEHGHIGMSVIVAVFGLFCGVRAWGLYREEPELQRVGLVMMALLVLQLVLGIAAFAVVGARGDDPRIPVVEVVITSMHQANGAALLALAGLLVVWSRRRLAPAAVS